MFGVFELYIVVLLILSAFSLNFVIFSLLGSPRSFIIFFFMLFHLLQACENRVKEDETGHKHCTGQYFDYWSCVDKCVSSLHKKYEK